ncbi:hypothetical protein [Alteromonas mediterranea]|uniref:Uncharacterized protein n=1 Tax=Alteromonas mediterranea (strain DSM 17117 / CIP 110805 / LMG 28347 / Deep ecotype) TaxID=1774373 RepID=F2GC90_ALTMD|nr:hypothetical protein [Alteromonas mediterranea]AEA99046.1 hypothetical protein MADE_1014560 [Alteromonas mediterranea DE]
MTDFNPAQLLSTALNYQSARRQQDLDEEYRNELAQLNRVKEIARQKEAGRALDQVDVDLGIKQQAANTDATFKANMGDMYSAQAYTMRNTDSRKQELHDLGIQEADALKRDQILRNGVGMFYTPDANTQSVRAKSVDELYDAGQGREVLSLLRRTDTTGALGEDQILGANRLNDGSYEVTYQSVKGGNPYKRVYSGSQVNALYQNSLQTLNQRLGVTPEALTQMYTQTGGGFAPAPQEVPVPVDTSVTPDQGQSFLELTSGAEATATTRPQQRSMPTEWGSFTKKGPDAVNNYAEASPVTNAQRDLINQNKANIKALASGKPENIRQLQDPSAIAKAPKNYVIDPSKVTPEMQDKAIQKVGKAASGSRLTGTEKYDTIVTNLSSGIWDMQQGQNFARFGSADIPTTKEAEKTKVDLLVAAGAAKAKPTDPAKTLDLNERVAGHLARLTVEDYDDMDENERAIAESSVLNEFQKAQSILGKDIINSDNINTVIAGRRIGEKAADEYQDWFSFREGESVVHNINPTVLGAAVSAAGAIGNESLSDAFIEKGMVLSRELQNAGRPNITPEMLFATYVKQAKKTPGITMDEFKTMITNFNK